MSHETPQFEQFALCILQLHNCRGLNAEVPMRPDPAPMSRFRGQALTHEMAEDLFIGWMSEGPQLPSPDAELKPYSWLVAAGKNPVSQDRQHDGVLLFVALRIVCDCDCCCRSGPAACCYHS